MKNKHRIKQGLSLLLAGGIDAHKSWRSAARLCRGCPCHAGDSFEAATPETAEANVPTPNLVADY